MTPSRDSTSSSATGGDGDFEIQPDPASSIGLWASLSILLRRWPVILGGLVMTGLVAVAALAMVPPSYTATGSLLLFVPSTGTSTDAVTGATKANPYLGSRQFVGDLLVTLMSDPAVTQRVVDNGGTGTYKIVQGFGDASLVTIDTTGSTADEAIRTWSVTADEADRALARMQKAAGAPDDLLVTAQEFTIPASATKESGSRIRVLIMIVVLGAGCTVLLAYGVESFSRYRKSRPSGGRDPGSEDGAHPTGDRKSTQVDDDLARHREAIRAQASGMD